MILPAILKGLLVSEFLQLSLCGLAIQRMPFVCPQDILAIAAWLQWRYKKRSFGTSKLVFFQFFFKLIFLMLTHNYINTHNWKNMQVEQLIFVSYWRTISLCYRKLLNTIPRKFYFSWFDNWKAFTQKFLSS